MSACGGVRSVFLCWFWFLLSTLSHNPGKGPYIDPLTYLIYRIYYVYILLKLNILGILNCYIVLTKLYWFFFYCILIVIRYVYNKCCKIHENKFDRPLTFDKIHVFSLKCWCMLKLTINKYRFIFWTCTYHFFFN